MRLFGYARISTNQQFLDLQIDYTHSMGRDFFILPYGVYGTLTKQQASMLI